MEYIVETNDLTKQFAGKTAVNKVNMHIKKGDIYGFIGKNGAGKTTTMKLLLGMLYPTGGEIKLFGDSDLNRARKRIGSLIEAPGIYNKCTAYENMKRFSIINGGTDEEIKDILRIVGLDNTGNRKAGNFSLGMRQRLGIGLALLGNPELLILDEPINGLDPSAIKEIRDTILRLNRERQITILISSHLLDELAKITTRYGIVSDGSLVEEIEADELMERCRENLKITVNDTDKAVQILKKEFSISEAETKGDSLYIYQATDSPEEINEVLVKSGLKVKELTFCADGFEKYFIERIGN